MQRFIRLAMLFILVLVGGPAGMMSSSPAQALTPAPGIATHSIAGLDCADSWQTISRQPILIDRVWLEDIAVLSATDAWAVGVYDGYDVELPLIQHWDGTIWSRMAGPALNTLGAGLKGVAAISPNNIWAVGYEHTVVDETRTLILHWDGSSWARIDSPTVGVYGELYSITAVSASDLWAVGSNSLSEPIVLHWNGSTWQLVDVPKLSQERNWLNRVTALSGNQVWAVGGASLNSGVQPYVLRWSGSSWALVQPATLGVSQGELYGVSASSSQDVWLVGESGVGTLTIHSNGTAWQRVPSLSSGYLRDVVALAPGQAWAVGFDSYVGITLYWDGTSWVSVAAPAERSPRLSAISALSAHDLFAVGSVNRQRQTLIIRHRTDVAFRAAGFSGSPVQGAIPAELVLSHTTPQTVTVDVQRGSGTALPGVDYPAGFTSVTIPRCASGQVFSLPVVASADWTRLKTINLTLANPQNAGLGAPATARATVIDPQQLLPGLQIRLPIAGSPAPPTGRLAFVSERDSNREIYVMNPDSTNQRRLTYNGAEDLSPTWSPDGSRIAFVSRRDGNYEIYTMRADGSDLQRLTNNTVDDFTPAWSPDGTRIAFASRRNNVGQDRRRYYTLIYTMNADGSGQQPLTPADGGSDTYDGSPSWSPDGSQIVFQSKRAHPFLSGVFLVNADGSQLTGLVGSQSDDCHNPSWSPKGLWIAFACGNPMYSTAYLISPDGQRVRRLNANFITGDSPTWSPDGTRVAMSDTALLIISDLNHQGTVELRQISTVSLMPAWSSR